MAKEETKQNEVEQNAVAPKKQSIEDMERELKALEIEAKKAELEDLKERLQERQVKRETRAQRGIINGRTLKSLAENDAAAQTRCNHRKGGNGVDGIIGGKGDDPQYAVIKHQFLNGDVWVRCLRCGKTWKPPLESEFKTKEAFAKAEAEYKEAVAFQTRNTMSGSVQFRFSDGGEIFRETMKGATLR